MKVHWQMNAHDHPCDQIWRNFATNKMLKVIANFLRVSLVYDKILQTFYPIGQIPYCKSPTMGRPKNIFFKKDAPNQSVTARDSQWLEAVNFNRI